MIRVDQARCAGCGLCVDECPVGAITLVGDIAMVDSFLCDGCESHYENLRNSPDQIVEAVVDSRERQLRPRGHSGLCIDICPNGALTWVADMVPEMGAEPAALEVVESPVEIMSVKLEKALPWRQTIVPAVGSALAWVGREVVPRIAPIALDLLDSKLARGSGGGVSSHGYPSTLKSTGRVQGRQRRHRRRRRQPED
jgi:ferredoxin